MKVSENPAGKWVVTDTAGKVVHTADSSQAAWDWLDRNEVHDLTLTSRAATRHGTWRVPNRKEAE